MASLFLILCLMAAGVVATYWLIDRWRSKSRAAATLRAHSYSAQPRHAQQDELGMESAMPYLSQIAGADTRN